MFSWQDVYPHLAGLIAGIGAWALQLTSIQYIRRHWFDVRAFGGCFFLASLLQGG